MTVLPYRSTVWVALTLFSLIALLSILDGTNKYNRGFEEKWSISLASISLGISFLAAVAHMARGTFDKFVGQAVEGFFIIIVVLAWILAVPVIMGAQHGLAMRNSSIIDANLFFSSWLAFCLSLMLFLNFGRETGRLGEDKLMRYNAKYWFCLFLSSMIALAAALRIFRDSKYCDNNKHTTQCDALRMGIALSIVSAVIAFIIVIFACFVQKSLSHVLLVIAAILVLALWSVLVSYLTFKNGPGSFVGTLYFATWISCIISLFLTMSHIFVAYGSRDEPSTSYSISSPSQGKTKVSSPKKSNTTNNNKQTRAEQAV